MRVDLNLRLDDFFWEPFYQLLRQQMLAFQMEKAREAATQCVRVLHISPAGNRRLHAVTSPALKQLGEDAFAVFAKMLVHDDRFIARTILSRHSVPSSRRCRKTHGRPISRAAMPF